MIQQYNNANLAKEVAILLASVKEDLQEHQNSIYQQEQEERASKRDSFRNLVDTNY